MQYFDDHDVERLLDYPRLIEAMRTAHRNGTMPQTRFSVASDAEAPENTFVTQFAWEAGQAIAVKLDSLFPGNATLTPPLPSVQGVTLLFDGRIGIPQASFTGSKLTLYKTAADSALAADFLSRKDAQTLLMVGAGALAPHLIAAMRSVRPSINKILVWNRHMERAEQLVEKLTHEGCSAFVAPKLDEAVGQADIISCATMVRAPLIQGAFLKSGCHIDLVGAYTPQMREADDVTIRRAGRLFVDGPIIAKAQAMSSSRWLLVFCAVIKLSLICLISARGDTLAAKEKMKSPSIKMPAVGILICSRSDICLIVHDNMSLDEAVDQWWENNQNLIERWSVMASE